MSASLNDRQGTTSRWQLEVSGRALPIRGELVVGRDPEADVPIEDDQISWRHVLLTPEPRGLVVRDLESLNGTFVNGQRLDTEPLLVTAEAVIELGRIRGFLSQADRRQVKPSPFRRIPLQSRTLKIGRAPDNDVDLPDDLNVSWYHAEVRPGDPPTIHDVGSRNGVRFGRGQLSGTGALTPGIKAGIGRFSMWIESGDVVVQDTRAALALEAQQVGVGGVRGTRLEPTDLRIASGEFVALIGRSGAGKSTLLKCLAGVVTPSTGRVLVGGEPLSLRLTDVGYVPQHDVAHDQLTVVETLSYAARLRLPSDTRHEERSLAVQKVMDELQLNEVAHKKVKEISGGERKRVVSGVELIGNPTMLLLDEPTSGLDPALERRVMTTLRGLADSGRGVAVVTHATSSLALCDTVAVMGVGGHLLFTGTPRESLKHFQVGAYDQIYDATDLVPPPTQIAVPASGNPGSKQRQALLSGHSLLKHTAALTGRYARTLLRERRTLAIQLLQAPLMGLLVALLYPANVLARPGTQPGRAAQFVFLLVTVALWLGLFDSCREIVKERSIVMRELAVGLRLDAYLISKTVPLLSLSALQSTLLLAAAAILQPLHASSSGYVTLALLLILTSWAAVGFGLVLSTVVRTVDQSTSLIPLLLIPQLLFGAALVPFASMQAPVKVVADLMASRWAFASAGHLIDMNARFAHTPAGTINAYGTSFFTLTPGAAMAILAGMAAAGLLAAALLLARSAYRNQD